MCDEQIASSVYKALKYLEFKDGSATTFLNLEVILFPKNNNNNNNTKQTNKQTKIP